MPERSSSVFKCSSSNFLSTGSLGPTESPEFTEEPENNLCVFNEFNNYKIFCERNNIKIMIFLKIQG